MPDDPDYRQEIILALQKEEPAGLDGVLANLMVVLDEIKIAQAKISDEFIDQMRRSIEELRKISARTDEAIRKIQRPDDTKRGD